MRIAGYLRVSTLKQAEDGVSIEMQKRIIINHCEMLEIISDESEIKWYIDDGWSAKSLEYLSSAFMIILPSRLQVSDS